ncbi:type IV secretion system protein TrbL [Paracoccus versutus]|uniref:Type IV secretion system protein TrbL n=1 Tax=Paracoccus versutus TaxID=34007 RepID=A0A3D9XCP5_PARVE|nr:type IV secretion system protein TrbL [Paracoccus versutus]
MGGTGVIDNFLGIFTSYIDSGFGLLGGEVAFIATTLIVIDVTLAALFWAWGADDDVLARLVKKTLFVGVFAYIISNWNNLARIVFESFAGLGLMASGTGFSVADLLRPGRVAQTGLDAGRPLLESISDLMGWVAVFEKSRADPLPLLRLGAGHPRLLHPGDPALRHPDRIQADHARRFRPHPLRIVREDRLHGRARAGQRDFQRHQSAGLGRHHWYRLDAVQPVHRGLRRSDPTIDDAMAIVLAALSLLGLGIFGPGIATGLVSGGPQLGAGAVVGTGLAVGGAAVAAGGATMLARAWRSRCPVWGHRARARWCCGRRGCVVGLYTWLHGRIRCGWCRFRPGRRGSCRRCGDHLAPEAHRITLRRHHEIQLCGRRP